MRRDWTVAIERLRAAIAEAEAAHLAGYLVMGTDFSCVVRVWEGAVALVAGEETALLAALAGDRGMPVIRPPYPTERGLGGAPTTVQNGETLAHAAWIATHGAKKFRAIGSKDAPGTKLVSVYGRVAQPGLVEVALGTPLSEIVEFAGGGTGTTKAVFVGGPGGGAISADAARHAVRLRAAPRRRGRHRPRAVPGRRHRHLHGRLGPLLPRLLGPRGVRQGGPVPDRHQAAGRDARPHPGREPAAERPRCCSASCPAR